MKFTPNTPSRVLNTVFMPSAALYTMCIYTVSISATATLAANQSGSVDLRSDTAATPTTVRCSTASGLNLTLGVAIGFVNSQSGLLVYIVPPGHNVKLVTASTGSPSITLIAQTEITISSEIDPVDFATGFPFR